MSYECELLYMSVCLSVLSVIVLCIDCKEYTELQRELLANRVLSSRDEHMTWDCCDYQTSDIELILVRCFTPPVHFPYGG
jgi:hypothetical protein